MLLLAVLVAPGWVWWRLRRLRVAQPLLGCCPAKVPSPERPALPLRGSAVVLLEQPAEPFVAGFGPVTVGSAVQPERRSELTRRR